MAHSLEWGWHPDPFGVHEERYVSVDGEVTKLVRDGGAESYDPPPRLRLVPDAKGDGAKHRGDGSGDGAADWYRHVGCHEMAETAVRREDEDCRAPDG